MGKPKEQNSERVKSVQTRQALVICLNAFTFICVVIFLQIMMFVQNAVPLTNGILMSSASSITYFVMSILTMFFLFACHEVASYMLLTYHHIITLLYALIVLALGIVCMIIDLGGANAAAIEVWKTLSFNQ